MEQKILVKHKQAYDTEENWTANNPILLAGQLAYSSDKYGKYKLGNGTAHWNDLDYCNEKVFTGTRAEYEAANSNGEIKPGTIVNITDDNDYQGIDIDTELSEESENLVINKAVTTGIKYNDTKDNTTTFLSDDTLEPEGYSDISLLKSSETHSSIFNKLSTMFKNVRYLFGMLGTTDISSIGDGTVTDAISRINIDLAKSYKHKGGFVGNIDDLRKPTDNGVYYINSTSGTTGDVPGFVYYFLSVIMSSENTGVQVAYVAAYNNQSTLGRFALRTYINNQWYEWLYFDSDITLEKKINNCAKNEMIPYLFQYAAAKQPVFVLSNSSEDTMYMGDRGCKRNSSTKALIIKSENDGFCSYGILSSTKEGIECTALTEQGGTLYVGAYASPKGNTVYFSQMQTRYTSSATLPVIATVNGVRQEITESCFNYRNADMRLFAFTMADFYLF